MYPNFVMTWEMNNFQTVGNNPRHKPSPTLKLLIHQTGEPTPPHTHTLESKENGKQAL